MFSNDASHSNRTAVIIINCNTKVTTSVRVNYTQTINRPQKAPSHRSPHKNFHKKKLKGKRNGLVRWSPVQTSVLYHSRFVLQQQVCGGRYSFLCMGFLIFFVCGWKRGKKFCRKRSRKENFCFRLIAYRYFSVRFFSFFMSSSVKHSGSMKNI